MEHLQIKDFLNYRYLSKLEASPDGRRAVILANWTDKDQCVTVSDNRFDCSRELKLISYGKENKEETISNDSNGMNVNIPALGCAILVQ